MKKLAFGIGVLLLLAIVLPTMAAPAELEKDISCNLLDAAGDYTIQGTGNMFSTSSGNSILVCKAQLTGNFPVKAVIWDNANTGRSCGTKLGITEDFQEVITPSGQISMTCHFKAVKA